MEKRIHKYYDTTYQDMVNEEILKSSKLKEQKEFDQSIKKLLASFSILKKVNNSTLREKLRKELSNEIYRARTTKIKSIILDLGVKYPRLEISDIQEKCDEEEELIISIAEDMI